MLNANSTRCSQAVTQPSTNHVQIYLTAVIGQEPVFSTWCGRWRTEYSGCSLLDVVSQYVIYTLSKGNIYFSTVSEPFCIRTLVSVKRCPYDEDTY